MNTKEKINSGSKEVQIWDMPLRGFHLLLILSIGFLLATGFLAPEWWLNYHVQAGYFLMWLLIFRLSWGLLGSQYSRFSSLKLSYQQFSHWIKTLNKKTSQNITGHNPAGSWMIVMMFVAIMLLLTTGIWLLGAQELLGLFANFSNYTQSEWLVKIHSLVAWVVLGLVIIHILAVAVHELLLKHRLIAAMIHGKNRICSGTPTPFKPERLGFLISISVPSFVLLILTNINPDLVRNRWNPTPTTEEYTQYLEACSECHSPPHPSLNNLSGWTQMMGSLNDHFGEDASLSSESHKKTVAFLTNFNAAQFDTQVSRTIANQILIDPAISKRPVWKSIHKDLDSDLFLSKPVYAAINCDICHKDADTGMFADSKIKLPDSISYPLF